MFEAIASFLIVCSIFLNIAGAVFLVLGFLAAMADMDFAERLLGVALYAAVVSAVFLIAGGLLTLIPAMIGLFF